MDWSYVAGFFDGEGTVSFGGGADYRVTITQAHEGVLTAIKQFTGLGNIWKARKRKAHWKESWIYTIARQEEVLFFLKSVHPFLYVKRERARVLIPTIAELVAKNRKKKDRLQKKIRASKLLREKGFSYREIGKKLKIDHGYVRRLVLFK